MKVRGFLKSIGAIVCCMGMFFGGACSALPQNNLSSESQSGGEIEDGTSSGENMPSDDTLNWLLANTAGKTEYKLQGVVKLITTIGESTLLGSDDTEEVVLDGQNETTLKVTGEENNIIRGANDAKLVIKNMTIVDKTTGMDGYGWYANYLDLGGRLSFENCLFDCSIFLTDTEAEFVNCQFVSKAYNLYSVWVGGGDVTFQSCTFKGSRGMKIHDSNTGAGLIGDVQSVMVDGCEFDCLTVKPGLAIGLVQIAPTNTFITVKNSRFNSCQPWDREGALDGIDGLYETDTAVKTEGSENGLILTLENNTIDGVLLEG